MTEQKSIAWRWFLIALVVGAAVWAFWTSRSPEKPFGMALGQDLRGGTTLRFQLDLEGARRRGEVKAGESDTDLVSSTLKLLEKRINKYGLAEVNLTSLGENRFEISVPAEVDAEAIQKVVEAIGVLQFRIEVQPEYGNFEGENGETRTRNQVWMGAQGPGGDADKFEATAEGFRTFKEREATRWKAARDSGSAYEPLDRRYRLVPRYRGANAAPPSTVADFVVLEEPTSKSDDLTGDILSNIRAGSDRYGQPGVHFDVKVDYHRVFREWTGKNVGLPMAIVLNGQYDSAPIINSPLEDSVVISLGGRGGGGVTGSAEAYRETVERQQNLIATLQSGSLKVTPRFEAKSRVGPTLAGEAVRRGLLSTVLAFLLVLAYMAVYYFLAGVIADVALLLNLVLLVGAMAFLRSTLTLPGIAGIVLTLGMAVDANILVFERIREELKRGRTVAQAVAEGFDRAFTTIVDSNVTTFLTAAFLYVFGTGAIQGFAVTLTLGLLASMFTAVFVARTFFEWWVRAGAKTVRMLGEARVPGVSWMKLRRVFIPASVAVMVVSLVTFFGSPAQSVYDIDFTGGMKVQARFNDVVTVDQVKTALDGGAREVRIPKAGAPTGSGEMRNVKVGPYTSAEVVTVRSEGRWVEIRHPLAVEGGGDTLSASEQLDAFQAYVAAALKEHLIPSWVVERPAPYKASGDADPWKAMDGALRLKVAIEDPARGLTAEVMKKAFARMPYFDPGGDGRARSALPASRLNRTVEVRDGGSAEGGEAKVFEVAWKSVRASDGKAAEDVPETLVTDLREFLSGADFRSALQDAGVTRAAADGVVLADPFPVNDLVGPGVAKRMRNDALLALLLSFVAIVIYVAFRFRSYAMGFASVLCLVHDVTIALGVVCLVDNLGLVDAKINMGLMAAFLTIVGYSVNDTVVTFDRIRELRGKAPNVSTKTIDDAVNQTLARTIRTSLTVFLTLVVLFAVNVGQRSLLEGISFTLLAGTIVGAYSTIGIAAPLLLFLPWFWQQVRRFRPRLWAATWPARKPWGYALIGLAVLVTIAVAVMKDVWLGVFWGLLMTPLLATLGLWLLWAVGFSAYALVAGAVMVVPWSFRDDPEAAAEAARRAAAAEDAERTPAPDAGDKAPPAPPAKGPKPGTAPA